MVHCGSASRQPLAQRVVGCPDQGQGHAGGMPSGEGEADHAQQQPVQNLRRWQPGRRRRQFVSMNARNTARTVCSHATSDLDVCPAKANLTQTRHTAGAMHAVVAASSHLADGALRSAGQPGCNQWLHCQCLLPHASWLRRPCRRSQAHCRHNLLLRPTRAQLLARGTWRVTSTVQGPMEGSPRPRQAQIGLRGAAHLYRL